MLNAGAGSGTATLAAEFIRQHPNSRHCLIPSWMAERQPQGIKALLCTGSVHQCDTQPLWWGTTPCRTTRTCFPKGIAGVPQVPAGHRRGFPCFSTGASSPRSSFQREGFQPRMHHPALQSPNDPRKLCPPGSTLCSSIERHVLLGGTWTSKTQRHSLASP